MKDNQILNSLSNKGLAVLGKPKYEVQPIVVCGPARGGTSMVAGVLDKIGIFMGDKATSPVFEDIQLSLAIENKDISLAKKISDEYTRKHHMWGWKRPSSINYLSYVDQILNSPSYIFIFKDIFSISLRNNISMDTDLISSMRAATLQYSKCLDFIEEKKPYAMLISYEKAMLEPKLFISNLINFINIYPNEKKIQQALQFINPNSIDYLDNTRISKAQGRLGGVKGRIVFGWARYVHISKTAKIEFFLNGKSIGTTLANIPREDLLEKFKTPCAYFYEIPKSFNLKSGDIVRAKVINEVTDLDNSPLTFYPDNNTSHT